MFGWIPLVVIAVLVISVLILVHEIGHFVAAKLSGVWVEEFGLGLPPRIWGKKIGDTIYSINWLPFGGFVRLHGETKDERLKYPKRAYVNKSKKARAFMTISGVVMNMVLAVFVFTLATAITGILRPIDGVRIVDVVSNTPAERGGIEIGDVIKSIDGVYPKKPDEFIEKVNDKKGTSVEVVVNREGNEFSYNLKPREEYPEEEGSLGVAIVQNDEFYHPVAWKRPFMYLYHGVLETYYVTRAVAIGFVGIFVDISSGTVPKGITGPLGVTAIIAEFAKEGLLQILRLTGLISVNLAILNMVPFPPLDGSRIVFIGLEGIFGKRKLSQIENYVQMIGMIVLLLLMALLTINEVPKIFKAGSLSGFVDSLIQ